MRALVLQMFEGIRDHLVQVGTARTANRSNTGQQAWPSRSPLEVACASLAFPEPSLVPLPF